MNRSHFSALASLAYKDLHSLQIHAAAMFEWITSEPFIVCSANRNLVAHYTLYNAIQCNANRNLVAAQEAPDPPLLPLVAFKFTKLFSDTVYFCTTQCVPQCS